MGCGFLKLESVRILKYALTKHTKMKSIKAEYKNVLVVPTFDCSLPPMMAPVLCPSPPYIAFMNINCNGARHEKQDINIKSMETIF